MRKALSVCHRFTAVAEFNAWMGSIDWASGIAGCAAEPLKWMTAIAQDVRNRCDVSNRY